MIRIETLSPQTEANYREFLLRDPQNMIYGSIEFLDFLVRAVGGEPNYLLALDESRRITGALPYFRLVVPGIGTVINSLPWYGSHGGCILSGEQAGETRRALLQCYRETIGNDVLSATMVLTPREDAAIEEYRSILAPSAEDRRIGQVTALPVATGRQEKELESALLQKTRNLVRKSLKLGFELQDRDDDDSWRFLYKTHRENMQAIGGRPKPWEHFVALRETLPSRRLLVALFEGLPVAALLLLYFNRTVEYITPVIKHEYRSRQPLSFLIWHAMLDAARSGYLWWNWGGTWLSQTSLHHFKAGWGAVDMPYTYLVVSSPEGRAKLLEHRSNLSELFPFYYTYPYAQLCP